ncbi:TPA: hypothetical protein DD394_05730 [bacterium UBP9_UBA11836]|nr:hypothetical protein [bacterium UBP9_UBA11836]
MEKAVALQERCQYFSIKIPSDSTSTEKVLAGGFLLDRFMAAYILASKDGLLFIDSGWDENLAAYMLSCTEKLLAENSLEPRQYFLLNTHRDWDHAWANRAFRQAWGSKLHISSSLETFLAMRQDLRFQEVKRRQEFTDGAYFAASFIELPDLLWADGEKIFLGNLEVTFVKVSAHCEGQLAVWVPQLKILFAADSCEGPLPFPKSNCSLAEQLADFNRLLALPAEQIWPSHHLAWSNNTGAEAWTIGKPELLQANKNYYKQIEINYLRYASPSLKKKCSLWLSQNRHLLSTLLNDEDAWNKAEDLAKQPLLEQLLAWEKCCHIDIEHLAKQTERNCSDLFYQRAHHLAVLMVLERYNQMV